MAIHAGLGRWNVGKRRILDSGVTVPAIDSQAAHVMLVAKRNGLLDWNLGARRVIGMVELGKSPCEKTQNKHASENAESGESVGAAMKNL
jgi:hypothetical protein